MKTQYKIELPIPSRILSPNARVHWAQKAAKTKNLREMAYLVSLAVMALEKPLWEKAFVDITYFFPQNRRRDKDNLLSMLKAAFDGIGDSGMVKNDCGFTYRPIELKIDKKDPRVEITITKEK